jgi:hypothetical protein
MRLLFFALASTLATGCAVSIPDRLREGRLDDAWDATCSHLESDSTTPLTAADRDLMRAALLARTRVALTATARTPAQLVQTLGEAVLPPDAALVTWKLEAVEYPGVAVKFEPRAVVGKAPIAAWHGDQVWRLAGVEPPRSATYDPKFSGPGALLDALVLVVTGGIAGGFAKDLSPQFRGTPEWQPKQISPGRDGTGTRVQTEVLALVEKLDGATCEATLEAPCERTMAMDRTAPVGRPALVRNHSVEEPVLGGADPQGDALIVRIEHRRFRSDAYVCPLDYEVAVPLPDGASFAERVNRLFASGPVWLGGAAR